MNENIKVMCSIPQGFCPIKRVAYLPFIWLLEYLTTFEPGVWPRI